MLIVCLHYVMLCDAGDPQTSAHKPSVLAVSTQMYQQHASNSSLVDSAMRVITTLLHTAHAAVEDTLESPPGCHSALHICRCCCTYQPPRYHMTYLYRLQARKHSLLRPHPLGIMSPMVLRWQVMLW